MKLVPYNKAKLPGRGVYSKSENFRILEEFANSDYDCVEIEDYPQKTAAICVASLQNSIKTYKMYGIQALMREGKVFLIRRI